MSAPAPWGRAIRAQAATEVRLTARRGENLLAVAVIPAVVLIFFSSTRVVALPGGYGTAVALCTLCMIFILQAIVFFIYKPDSFDATYASSVAGGVLLTVLVGELLVRGRTARLKEART